MHITREGSLVLTRKTYRKRVLADALSKAPSTEGGEVQFVVVACNSWLAAETVVVEELSLNALATVELLQVMDGGVAVRKFGKLGESEVITPKKICYDMVTLIPDDAFTTAVDDYALGT